MTAPARSSSPGGLVVNDGRLAFDYHGVCGYAATFDYAG